MKIIRAKVLGYCMGVRRAVTSAESALEKKASRVFTLGPLIHNPVALNALSSRGLEILDADKIDSLKSGDTVIIRAHGVPPALERKLRKTGCTVVNATCPRVLIEPPNTLLRASPLSSLATKITAKSQESRDMPKKPATERQASFTLSRTKAIQKNLLKAEF